MHRRKVSARRKLAELLPSGGSALTVFCPSRRPRLIACVSRRPSFFPWRLCPMTRSNHDVAPPNHDNGLALVPQTHHPSRVNGAAVHTKMHRFQDPGPRATRDESRPSAAPARAQAGSAEALTTNSPPHARGRLEPSADGAAVHTNLHRFGPSCGTFDRLADEHVTHAIAPPQKVRENENKCINFRPRLVLEWSGSW